MRRRLPFKKGGKLVIMVIILVSLVLFSGRKTSGLYSCHNKKMQIKFSISIFINLEEWNVDAFKRQANIFPYDKLKVH